MATYRIDRYPRQMTLRDGTEVTLRPMTREDGDALLSFFRAVPEQDRFFLKDDVASEEVVKRFVDQLDYDRALPLLATYQGQVVADAVLLRHRGGHLAHKAEIRALVHPDFRGRGIGRTLMRELIEIAWDAELESVEFELVKDVQSEMIGGAEAIGAFLVGTLTDHVKDAKGHHHDVVFLRIPLGRWWQWSQF